MKAAAAAGPNGVAMELGGKSAMIVFDDVEDVKSTVDWYVARKGTLVPRSQDRVLGLDPPPREMK